LEQESIRVQALPSLQALVLFVKTHPVEGAQESVVHGLLSLQASGALPWQEPPPQVSPMVQALPSSHAAALFAWSQPVTGLHVSSVQELLSLHANGAPPLHEPPAHVSALVQALPSLQEAALLVWTHPVEGSHLSSVQGLWSSHELELSVKTQPTAGSQASSVHALLSPQLIASLGTQLPSRHRSPDVQALSSEHTSLLFVWMQPVAGSQESSVQGLSSLQSRAMPEHAPLVHASPEVQRLPSVHEVPSGTAAVPHRPVPGSHTPIRQTVLNGAYVTVIRAKLLPRLGLSLSPSHSEFGAMEIELMPPIE
jgi:hypothetical protein